MSLLQKVLTFTKRSGTGSQAVAGLGFQPVALILYSGVNVTNATFEATIGSSFAFLTASSQVNHARASLDASATSAAKNAMAAAAFQVIDQTGTVLAAATLTSLDSDGFTLNWTTSGVQAYIIGVIALGGSDLVGAVAHTISLPTTAGNVSKTGIGFRPDCVLFLAGSNTSTALPFSNLANARLQLGAMDAQGNQWALSATANDAVNPSSTARLLETDACYVAIIPNVTTPTTTLKAGFVSMDADGYTINLSVANGSAVILGALALQGGRWRVGNTAKPTGGAPATHAVTGVGFLPSGVILAGVQATNLGTTPVTQSRLGFGAASGTGAAAAIAGIDTHNITPTQAKVYTDTAKAFVKVNNITPAVDASAALASFNTDGFTLTWNPNDAVATQVGFVAAGDWHLLATAPKQFRVKHPSANHPRGWRRRTA